MYLMTTAKTLGLTAEDGEMSGTIEERLVLAAFEELAAAHPDHADLFIVASDTVRSSRSAGLEVLDEDSVFGRFRDSNEIQLRYKAEMRAIIDDLAIDLALRGVQVAEPKDPAGATT